MAHKETPNAKTHFYMGFVDITATHYYLETPPSHTDPPNIVTVPSMYCTCESKGRIRPL